MKWSNNYRIRLVLIGFAAVIVVIGGNAKADFTFGTPTNLGPTVNSMYAESGQSISADALTLYFGDGPTPNPWADGGADIWMTMRNTINDEWEPRINLGPTVNSSSGEGVPNLSADGLSLYFSSDRPGGFGNADIWVAKRATKNDDWGEPMNLGPTVNSSAEENFPSISTDGLELYFCERQGVRPGGYGGADLWVTKRPTKDDPWGTPVNLGNTINSSYYDATTFISADSLTLFFSSSRPGGVGGEDIWMTRRATVYDPWTPPVNLGPSINSSAHDALPDFSANGSTLYFSSKRSGGSGDWDLWQVSINPVVDINGDHKVDSADMHIMVDHWGENYPLCDIGPTPLGDGIVDVQDLIVLAEHLFEEVFPIELIGYWKLDEEEGDIASDSAGDNAGLLFGGPLWQPAEGKRDGALEFDGIDDHVITDSVLDPVEGPFSTFVWIKGGAPGQVIISQADGIGTGETWLGMDALGGNLKTGLVPPPVGRFIPQPLGSQAVITDDQWHHIGFVWDGSYRILYVDGTEVAKDTNPITLAPLKSANGGLYIGAGKNLSTASFFSGLMDDVRIYNMALSPAQITALAQ